MPCTRCHSHARAAAWSTPASRPRPGRGDAAGGGRPQKTLVIGETGPTHLVKKPSAAKAPREKSAPRAAGAHRPPARLDRRVRTSASADRALRYSRARVRELGPIVCTHRKRCARALDRRGRAYTVRGRSIGARSRATRRILPRVEIAGAGRWAWLMLAVVGAGDRGW